MVIGDWKKASTEEEENPNNMNTIITSRHIFVIAGSATGEQALAMLKAQEDERVAAVVAAAKIDLPREEGKRHYRPRHHRLRDFDKTRAARPFRAATPED